MIDMIKSKFIEWEKQIGLLSQPEWEYMATELPDITAIIPSRVNNSRSLLKAILTNVKGQDKAVNELFKYLKQFESYWEDMNQGRSPQRPPSHKLLIGATGTGKSYLVSQFAKHLNAHLISIDCSRLVAEGYVGAQLHTELGIKYFQILNNFKDATRFIVFLDEFDKVCDSHLDVKSAVLNELLILLDNKTTTVGVRQDYKNNGSSIDIKINGFCFILGGAFTGLRASLKRGLAGFIPSDVLNDKINLPELISWGVPGELAGRIGSLIHLNILTKEMIIDIMQNSPDSPYAYYQNLFLKYNNPLNLSREELIDIARQTLALNVGARGIASVLDTFLRDRLFSLFTSKNT